MWVGVEHFQGIYRGCRCKEGGYARKLLTLDDLYLTARYRVTSLIRNRHLPWDHHRALGIGLL